MDHLTHFQRNSLGTILLNLGGSSQVPCNFRNIILTTSVWLLMPFGWVLLTYFLLTQLRQTSCLFMEGHESWEEDMGWHTDVEHPRSNISINVSGIYNPILETGSKSFQML